MTYTYAKLKISKEAYTEIRSRLVAAGYADVVREESSGVEVIDMHGLALTPFAEDEEKKK